MTNYCKCRPSDPVFERLIDNRGNEKKIRVKCLKCKKPLTTWTDIDKLPTR